MSAEKFEFQAEVAKLLQIVTHSLYSEKEIFLRELISNASDACERLRYQAISEPALIGEDGDFRIDLHIDKDAGTLTIADNGSGMNRDELIQNLGTIAHSGSGAFVEQMAAAQQDGDLSVIGQFGMGFYSAFMVADEVSVVTRRAGGDSALVWISEGTGAYTIDDAERAERGTSITLKLREDQKEYLERFRLEQVIKTYSDHIALPIRIHEPQTDAEDGEDLKADDDQPVNKASALWTRQKSEIEDSEYTEFYRHISHGFDEPWATLHTRIEGKTEFTLLLFIPTEKPFNLFHPDRKHQVKLYVKRVFITDDCQELAPSYLRFIRGIVDSEDLPLNVSREMLQNEPLLRHMRSTLVKRVLGDLEKKSKKDAEGFAKFWTNFGPVLKEGIYEDYEFGERILKLARFQSTNGDDLTSLEDYVSRMQDGQDAIYYITAEDADAARLSPQLEGFAKKGVEVLLLTDPVDDFWLQSRPDFDEKPFKSVTRGGADLDKIGGEDKTDTDKDDEKADDADMAVLVAALKVALGDDVKDVRTTSRLTESPVCLVADENDMDLKLERMLKQHQQLDQSSARILEINPDHALILRMAERSKDDGEVSTDMKDAALMLLDQARIIEGEPIPDPAAFSRRMASFMARGL